MYWRRAISGMCCHSAALYWRRIRPWNPIHKSSKRIIMRSIINRLTAFLCLCCFVTACKKEEKLSPTEEKENVYGDHTLPQGNHAYDADILQLFQKYNTLFLYKYVHHDLYYSQGYYSGYTGGTYDPVKDSVTRVGYFDVPANEAWIGQQLNLLK